MKQSARFTCCLIVLAACAASVAAQQPTVLPNGMTVLAVQAATNDVCGVHIALRIGPERVPPHKAGLRALTQQVILGHIRNRMSASDDLIPLRREGTQGAGFSVETEWDHVEFVASVTSRRLPLLLSFMGPAIFEAEWTDDDVVNAKELVADQDGAADDRTGAAYEAYYLFRRALVGDSPLAQPIFGTPRTRENITLADVKTFYQGYYVPNVATLCVVSPLPPQRVVQLAREAFGSYRQRRLTEAPPAASAAEDTRVEIGASPEQAGAVVVIGVPLPPVGSDGYIMGQIMYAALSGPQGFLAADGSLAAALPLTARLAGEDAGAFGVLPIPMERAPYLAVFARAAPTQVEDARRAILEQLLRFAEQPLSDEALHRAKLRALNLNAGPLSEPMRAATVLNRRFLLGAHDNGLETFADRGMGFSAEDIQQFAREQFTRHAIGVLMPGS